MSGNMFIGFAAKVKRVLRFAAARRLVHEQAGAAAVEFAMVAAPFLAMLFAIIETGLVFFASQTLETAAADSARLVMTGQAQTASFDQAKFKEAVCSKIAGLFNCSGISVDVQNYPAFSNVPTS